MQKPEDRQIVAIFAHFVEEVDCNSGARRRVYRDGRIEPVAN